MISALYSTLAKGSIHASQEEHVFDVECIARLDRACRGWLEFVRSKRRPRLHVSYPIAIGHTRLSPRGEGWFTACASDLIFVAGSEVSPDLVSHTGLIVSQLQDSGKLLLEISVWVEGMGR